MKLTKSLLVLCLFANTSFAQKNMQPGLIVLNSADTLKGFIDYREWYKNPLSIQFATAKNVQTKKYTAADISYFEVMGKEAFASHTVSISTGTTNLSALTAKDTNSIVNTVFLKVIEKGKTVSLFSYTDDVKLRFYLQMQNADTPLELLNTIYVQDEQVKYDYAYRSTLIGISNQAVPDDEAVKSLIATAAYTKKDLTAICSKINHQVNTNIAPLYKKNKGVIFYIGAGVNYGKLELTGNNIFAGLTNDASLLPVLSAGANIYTNPAIGKLYIQTQLSATGFTTKANRSITYFEATENHAFNFKQINVAVSAQLHYNLYNGPTVKWYVGAGGAANFSSYPVNEEKTERVALTGTTQSENNAYIKFTRGFWLNGVLKTGVNIKRAGLSISYHPNAGITSFSEYTLTNSGLQMQVNYQF
ncbi:hypothetical protein [Limnovirga soli]|uniref:Outer membrane protein beta-barrel domain-containing protein n=1 Tax=Limnovirga soli TaxID=2656915 RepID=A0A8J8FLD0_9BACT|nr:hypothetical protein [Limnovirga soli]NNV57976.1 hypothetical protein [Limnovirga soli]